MSQQNQLWEIIKGILLLIAMHAVAILIIFAISYILQITQGGYAGLSFFFALAALFLIQLLYVIPTCIWLKRKRKPLMMKGVIIGAVITALVNGGCFLLVTS
jgi:hypothetical protein